MIPFFMIPNDIQYRDLKNANKLTIQAKTKNEADLVLTIYNRYTGEIDKTVNISLTKESLESQKQQLQSQIDILQNQIDDLDSLLTDVTTEIIKLKDHL